MSLAVDGAPARRHGSRSVKIVPGAFEVEPTGSHGTGTGSEIVPGAADFLPAFGHGAGVLQKVPSLAFGEPPGSHGAGAGEIVPEAIGLGPTGGHRPGSRCEVVPGALDFLPAFRAGAGRIEVVPAFPEFRPARYHGSRSAQVIRAAIHVDPTCGHVSVFGHEVVPDAFDGDPTGTGRSLGIAVVPLAIDDVPSVLEDGQGGLGVGFWLGRRVGIGLGRRLGCRRRLGIRRRLQVGGAFDATLLLIAAERGAGVLDGDSIVGPGFLNAAQCSEGRTVDG